VPRSSRKRTGRRPGPTRTRGAILDAARAAFAARGYDAVSVRSVAREAGVDPALVHRFFGSKEQLFVAALELPVAPGALVAAVLADGVEGVGERLVRTLLTLWDAPGGFAPFLALVRGAVDNEAAATMLREFLTREVLGRIAAAAAPDRAELRASIAGSQVVGLAMARYIVRVPPLADAEREEIVAAVGPAIQRYLTGALGSA
jgi:AcrR family transcriptional regulator